MHNDPVISSDRIFYCPLFLEVNGMQEQSAFAV